MSITNKYARVPLEKITIDRDSRQRREIVVDDLLGSIKARGVIQPIIITQDFKLIAGERRYTASLQLGLPDIPCRFIASNYSELDVQIIELEENIKRRSLPWRDECLAISRLHDLYKKEDSDFTHDDLAEAIGISRSLVSVILRVARDIDSPKITDASGLSQAFNLLTRIDERVQANALSDIMEAGATIFSEVQVEMDLEPSPSTPQVIETNGEVEHPSIAAPPPVSAPVPPDSILNTNFSDWVQSYFGKPFNFIHCDFPYGVGVFNGKQSGRDSHETYNDDAGTYWDLLKVFCENLDKFMSHSAHLMFWFSMEHYEPTLKFFAQNAPVLAVQKFPLVWVKSDNVGILPDPKRGPRRIYETALIASREDRFIVRAISNSYSAPTDKTYHHSTKPEPMLKHFFQMFVDEHTSLFDPTCGSGSALRAAEALGATRTLGLELNGEIADGAKAALRKSRALRGANKIVSKE